MRTPVTERRTVRPLIERLFAKTVISDETGACWIWTGTKTRQGYGVLRIAGRTRLVHRVAYETLVDPIPEPLQLDHLCRTPACINPEHLEPVTRQENLDRGVHANRSKTHCPNGHPYDVFKWRSRRCSICLREQRRAYKQRQRERAAA